jgi:hypothetical protein
VFSAGRLMTFFHTLIRRIKRWFRVRRDKRADPFIY